MSLFAATLLMLAGGTADFWMVSDGRDSDRESILFVNKAEPITPMAEGWVTFSYYEARNGARARAAKSLRTTAWVNCKTREYINDFRMEYGGNGAMLRQGKLNEQQRRVPAPGSAEGKVLAFVCGDTRGATQLPQGANMVAYADSLYAQGHPQVARAPATPAPPSARMPAEDPARASDFWLVYDNANKGYEKIILVDRSSFHTRPAGGMTFSYIQVMNGSAHTLVKSMLVNAWANCKTRQYQEEMTIGYGNDGRGTEVPASEPRRVHPPGSINGVLLAFACGNQGGAVQLPRGADPVAYADDLYARNLRAAAAAEFWLILADESGEFTVFVDRASIAAQAGDKTLAAIETIDKQPGKFFWFKTRVLLDCARQRFRDLETNAFLEDGSRMGPIDTDSEAAIVPGTYMHDVYSFVCRNNRVNVLKLPPGVTTLSAAENVRRNSSSRNPPKPRP